MCAVSAGSSAARWLSENGPRELELLFRAIVFHPSAPILIIDSDGTFRDASTGVGKLLGVSREQIIGHPIDDFAPSELKPRITELFSALGERQELEGTLSLLGPDGGLRDVGYKAKGNVLPVRHVLVLHDTTRGGELAKNAQADPESIPSWVQDYALYLLDVEGCIAAWYSGAARIYSYQADEAIARHVSVLYPHDDGLKAALNEEFRRASAEGHTGTEGWQARKDGSRFWANAITMALRNEHGELQGFARVARDFSDRHERDEKLRRSRALVRPIPMQSTVAGVVSGEYDRVPEVNDAFLQLVGYSREELLSGRLKWADLTPPEYATLDELAHEESLRCGACTPFEKELIRKDGTRVPVLVATAVLKLSPFKWITLVQDLKGTGQG